MKTGLAAVVLFVSSCWSSGVHAASFDCAKARTGIEKAICADPALGRLDEAIGQAYRNLLGKVEPRYRPKVQEAQRNWLKARFRHQELRDILRERLDNLNNAFVTVNGVALLRVDGDSLPPYVLTPLPGAAAYNRMVDGILEESRSDHLLDADMAECDRLSDRQDTASPPPKVARKFEECGAMTSTYRHYRVDFVSPDLLSIEEALMEDPWRAAHPTNSDSHLNWWLSKPGKVVPEDMFASPAYRRVLAAGVRRYLNEEGADGKTVSDTDVAPDRWALTSTHLVITGQREDFGLGRGGVGVAIPWTDFGLTAKPQFVNLLKKGGRVTDPRLHPAAGKQ